MWKEEAIFQFPQNVVQMFRPFLNFPVKNAWDRLHRAAGKD